MMLFLGIIIVVVWTNFKILSNNDYPRCERAFTKDQLIIDNGFVLPQGLW